MTIQTLSQLPGGATVIDISRTGDKVLAFTHNNSAQPWVIWRYDAKRGTCELGHYYTDSISAMLDWVSIDSGQRTVNITVEPR